MLDASEIEAPPPQVKTNNYVAVTNPILRENKFMLTLRTLCGVNSIHLLSNNILVNIIFNVYCFLLCSFVTITYWSYKDYSTKRATIKAFRLLSYIIFSLCSFSSSKKKLKNYFDKMNRFDDILNIKNDFNITTPMQKINVLTALILICDFLLIIFSFGNIGKAYIFVWHMDVFILFGTNHLEQIFYFNMIWLVYKRVVVLRGHVSVLFSAGGGARGGDAPDRTALLARNKRLDTAALHQAYELLHNCCLLVNNIIRLPMTMIFLTSGLSTILILSNMIKLYPNVHITLSGNPIAFFLMAMISVTVFLVLPCYYASKTTSEVLQIQKGLQDAISKMPMDKLERRRVKTFYELTKCCRFEYALFGVIELNMTLPLSYMGLCFTYLVIVVQFSKFLT